MSYRLVSDEEFYKFPVESAKDTASKFVSDFKLQRAILRVLTLNEREVLKLCISWTLDDPSSPIYKSVDDFRFYLGLEEQCSYQSMNKYLHSLESKGFITLKKSKLNYVITVDYQAIGEAIVDNLTLAEETYKVYEVGHQEKIQESKKTNANNLLSKVPENLEVINSFNYNEGSIQDLALTVLQGCPNREVAAYFTYILWEYFNQTEERLILNAGTWNKLKQSYNEVAGQSNPEECIKLKVKGALELRDEDIKKGWRPQYFARYFELASHD